jgi:hypothetical protein
MSDNVLWTSVVMPLLCQHEEASRCLIGMRPNYLLSYLRSVRTPTTTAEYANGLKDRLRSSLLLESLELDRAVLEKGYLCALSQSLHRLPSLSKVAVIAEKYNNSTFVNGSASALFDFVASIPYPQQIRTLHVPHSDVLTQTILERFTNLEELKIELLGGIICCQMTNVHFCAGTLRRLYAANCNSLDDNGLSRATKLEVLDVSDCPGITTVAPFAATLVELHAQGHSGIGDAALRRATRIRRLFVTGNMNVTTVKPFAASLQELDASISGIDDKGLNEATSIVKLTPSFKIMTVKPFAESLRELNECRYCELSDETLCDATGIVKLVLRDESKVTTVKPFVATLRELDASYCESLSDDRFALMQRVSFD